MTEYGILIRRAIQGAWRRRRLLVTLTLLLGSVGVPSALLQPRTYVARTLLLLQEGDRVNPLTREPVSTPVEPIQARITSLKAILFSDYVLSEVINRTDPTAPISGRQLALSMQALQRALSLDLVGSEAIELRLSGNDANGLGKQLATVVETLLQTMMPQEGGTTAAQLLINNQKARLVAAQETNASLKQESRQVLPGGVQPAQERIAELERALVRVGAGLQATDGAPTSAKTVTGPSNAMPPANESGPVCVARAAALASTQGADKLSQITTDSGQAWAPGLIRCDELERELRNLREKVDRYHGLIEKIAVSDREVDIQQNLSRDYEIRLRGAVKAPGSSILKAPERIRIVDPPRDPDIPTKSRVTYAIAALLGSILVGTAIAVCVDYLDTRIFYPEELMQLGDLPIVATLHKSAAGTARRSGSMDNS
jgi:uncharacterized protein involved in exopolysaccharide biosynthesis